MKTFDVVIIGAGLAGLQCARLLSRRGAKILLVDRKKDLTQGIHTTGIFVRKTLEDFDFPAGTLGKAVRNVTLYSPKLKRLELKSDKDEFRVGKMGKLYEAFLEDCLKNSVEFASETSFVSAQTKKPETIVNLRKHNETFAVETKVLVGADGAISRVAKDLRLEENKEWIVGYEEVWENAPLENEPQLYCFLDAKLAPGYLAWITNDGEEVHVGVGGYAKKFNPREALKEFRQNIAPKFVDLKNAEIAETRGGRIPVGGVLRKIGNENGLLIGDAAGAVSPLTAGGLDPCLRLSAMAADVILERLKTGNPKILLNYSGEFFRQRFVSRLWMRRVIAAVSNQKLLEFGFGLLRGKIGRKFVRHIFFGRGSFPDVKLKINTEKNSLDASLLKDLKL